MFGTDRFRKRLRELEERVDQLETRAAQDRLGLLEVIERVTKRLEWRERKRAEAEADPQLVIDDQDAHALGFRRRFGNHERGG